MVELGVALGMIAPYYNLAMVVVVIWLFFALFRTEPKAKVFLFPWKLLFFSVIVFVVEEILTVLRSADVINIPVHINAFFELVIIAVFIYALLLQKEHVSKKYG
jgi:heme A synthase